MIINSAIDKNKPESVRAIKQWAFQHKPVQLSSLNPLEKAVVQGHYESVRKLLETNLPFRLLPSKLGHHSGLYVWKRFHYCFYLSTNRHQTCLKEVLHRKKELARSCILMAASKNDFTALYQALLIHPNANMMDFQGNTPLHYSASLGNLNAVDLLLAYGASTEVINEDGFLPIDLAIKRGHTDTAEKLLEYCAEPTQYAIRHCIEQQWNGLLIKLIKHNLGLLRLSLIEALIQDKPQSLLMLVNSFECDESVRNLLCSIQVKLPSDLCYQVLATAYRHSLNSLE